MDSGASTITEKEARRSQSLEAIKEEPPQVPAEADEAQQENTQEWKISKHELYIILSLTVINMVVALDASVIVTALNVSTSLNFKTCKPDI